MQARLRQIAIRLVGDNPSHPPSESSLSALMLAVIVGSVVMVIGEYHAWSAPPLLKGTWRLLVHGLVPLSALVFWEASRTQRGMLLATLGTVAVIPPVVIRFLIEDPSSAFKAQPELIVVPVVFGLVTLVGALRMTRVPASDWGLGAGDWRWWGPRVGGCLLILVPILVAAVMLSPELQAFYPSWRPARTDGLKFAEQHLGILLDFMGWELLFRGFLLFAVYRRGDPWLAVVVQAIPFFLLHADKPAIELASSLLGGMLAGWFCLRARSFWPLVIIHWVQMTTVGAVAFLLRV